MGGSIWAEEDRCDVQEEGQMAPQEVTKLTAWVSKSSRTLGRTVFSYQLNEM